MRKWIILILLIPTIAFAQNQKTGIFNFIGCSSYTPPSGEVCAELVSLGILSSCYISPTDVNWELGAGFQAGYIWTATATGGNWQAPSSGGSQTPWTQNINGAGYTLSDTGINWSSLADLGAMNANWYDISLYVNSLNGVNPSSWLTNVGIGTTNDIAYWNGSNTIGANNNFVLVGNNVGVGTYLPSQALEIGNQALDINSSGNIGIGTILPNNSLIVATGNVGIATAFPGTKLDVNGSVRMTGFVMTAGASSGYVLTSSGAGSGTWQAASGGSGTNYWLNNGGSNVGINTTQAVGIGTSFVGGSGEATLSVMNGNVGIGTWVPGQLLQIGTGQGFQVGSGGTILSIGNNTSSTLSGATLNFSDSGSLASIKNNSSTSASATALIGSTATNGYVELRETGGNDSTNAGYIKFTNGSNGANEVARIVGNNIGIGTTVPGGLLDVEGTVSMLFNSRNQSGGNVGIGTSYTPKLINEKGDLYMQGSASTIHMKDSGGSCWACTVAVSTGVFSCSSESCP